MTAPRLRNTNGKPVKPLTPRGWRYADARSRRPDIPIGQIAKQLGISLSHASLLEKHPDVISMMKDAREYAVEKAGTSQATYLMQVDDDRDFARKLKQPQAAHDATKTKGKVLGFLKEKQDGVNVNITQNTIKLHWGDASPVEVTPQ